MNQTILVEKFKAMVKPWTGVYIFHLAGGGQKFELLNGWLGGGGEGI